VLSAPTLRRRRRSLGPATRCGARRTDRLPVCLGVRRDLEGALRALARVAQGFRRALCGVPERPFHRTLPARAARPHESLLFQRGVVHAFDNRGDDDARFLAIISPGLLGPGCFEEIAEVVGVGGPPDVVTNVPRCLWVISKVFCPRYRMANASRQTSRPLRPAQSNSSTSRSSSAVRSPASTALGSSSRCPDLHSCRRVYAEPARSSRLPLSGRVAPRGNGPRPAL